MAFRLPERLRKQLEDAAWERRSPMGELLRQFTEEGLKRLARKKVRETAAELSGAAR